MKSRTSRLTRELLSLYIRYGAADFEAAAQELREGNFGRLIAETADNLGAAVESLKAKAAKPDQRVRAGQVRHSKRDVLMGYLTKLKASARTVDAAIAQFAELIARRDVLDTTAAVGDYMTLIGMPMALRTADRYQNIKRIADFLRMLPEAEAIEKIRSAEDVGDRSSSLQRWADIIVKPGGR